MNKRYLEAFAAEARDWRRIGQKHEAEAASTADVKARTRLMADANNAYTLALGVEYAVIKVAKRFSPSFDEAKFRANCNAENEAGLDHSLSG
jgi:hypothetical protein